MKKIFVSNIFRCLAFRPIYLLIMVFFLSACTTTTLPPAELTEASIKLSNLNHKQLGLDVKSELTSARLGWQYILMFIPFGQIEAERPKDFVFNRAFSKLSLAGYNVQPTWTNPPLTVVITIKDADLDAYDLLALRNVSGSLEIEVKLINRTGKLVLREDFSSSDNAWREFAFLPQLNYVFTRTVDSTIDKVVEMLEQTGGIAPES